MFTSLWLDNRDFDTSEYKNGCSSNNSLCLSPVLSLINRPLRPQALKASFGSGYTSDISPDPLPLIHFL